MNVPFTFHLIPHTHWDREWYLPRAGFLARLVPVLDDLLGQLGRDPGARFVLDGQTVLAEDYLGVRPGAAEALAEAARRGALDLGPWYILADELIPSGESLLRNLLIGTRDAARLGRRMDVLYSPDAFGHPGCLPALAAEFGLRAGVVWRGLGRPQGRDHDLYRWRGAAEPGLLVYHLPRAGYSVAADLPPAENLATKWRALRRELAARAGSPHVAVLVGADHHAAPADLAALRTRVQQLEPGHDVRVSSLSEFCQAVERSTATVASVRGELRAIDGHTWVLQGVHSTRARLKRRHSAVELELLHVAEPLAALATTTRDRRAELDAAWRALLQSQFHDTLGGCCADVVAQEQEMRLNGVGAWSREIAAGSLRDLTGHDPDRARAGPTTSEPRVVLWNPTPRQRSEIATAELTFFRRDVPVGPPTGAPVRSGPGAQPFSLVAASGDRIPVQVLGARRGQERLDAQHHHPDQDEVDRVFVAFETPAVAGLSLTATRIAAGAAPFGDHGLRVTRTELTNRFVSVRVTGDGGFGLEDRATGARYAGLGVLEDEPDAGDTYTFSRGRGPAPRGAGRISSRLVARGPLIGAIERRWSMAAAGGGTIGARQLLALHADSPMVRVRLDLDHRAVDHRLRARFPVGAGDLASAGAAFTVERRAPVRPSRRRRAIEQPVATAPAHRFVAAGDGRRGLALFAPGFFEYEWTAERDLRVTLIRAVGELSRADLPERPGHAGWPEPTPLAHEPGRHTIDLALAPVGSADLAHPDRLHRMWEDGMLPMQVVYFRHYSGSDAPGATSVSLEGAGLVYSAVKPAVTGAGLVLRCYNVLGRPAEGVWQLSRPASRAVRVRADESELHVLPLAADGRTVAFVAGPGEIVTIEVELEPAPAPG